MYDTFCKDERLVIEFFCIKTDTGVVFYDKNQKELNDVVMNFVTDLFIYNPILKLLVCCNEIQGQLSDVVTESFANYDFYEMLECSGNKYLLFS